MISQQLKEQIKLRSVFIPRQTKEDLALWIAEYLGLEFPDAIVDPDSTTTPMDYIWQMYRKALTGEDPEQSRTLAFASRDSYKTLGTAVVEFLMLVHLNRDVGHMAAIEKQAKQSTSYIQSFLSKPYFKKFVLGDNQRTKEFVRYENDKGDCLSTKEFETLPPPLQADYRVYRTKLDIVICTKTGANSLHVPTFCVSGSTKISVQNHAVGNRSRKTVSARGLFDSLFTPEKGKGGRSPAQVSEVHVAVDPSILVLSMDLQKGRLDFKPITHIHRRMATTMKIVTTAGDLVCTGDHPVWSIGRGTFVPSQDVKVGDRLLLLDKGQSNTDAVTGTSCDEYESYVDRGDEYDEWEQVVIGSILGDAGIYQRASGHNPYIKEQHCVEQAEYLGWKRGVISRRIRTVTDKAVSGFTGAAQAAYHSANSPLLLPFVGLRRLEGLERVGPLALSIWYQDDGCAGNGFRLSTECWNEEQNQKIAAFLRDRFGLEVHVRQDGGYFYIGGNVEAKRRLVEICSPHVHPDMAYKFDITGNTNTCSLCGRKYWHYVQGRNSHTCGSAMCRVVATGKMSVAEVVDIELRKEEPVYDFTVDGHHNFFTNGFLSKNCVDEVDLANAEAYEEAKMIPTSTEEKPAMTILTSTRKYAFGLVQDEIDRAHKTGLKVLHWNILDIAKKCDPSRHLPQLPTTEIWVDKEAMTMASAEEYARFTDEQKENYVRRDAFAGCLKNCSLFSVCQGRLATHQTAPKFPQAVNLQKPIEHLITQFKAVSPAMAKAQLLCRKPSQAGLIYPFLDRDVHMKTPKEIAEKVLGTEIEEEMTKEQLIEFFKLRGARFVSGMDFGYTHNWATNLVVIDGRRAFVLGSIAQAEILTNQQIELFQSAWGHLSPEVYADPENPQGIKEFKDAGCDMRKWTKGPGSVLSGIEVVRWMIRPLLGEPLLYFLSGDEDIDFLFTRMSQYHWKMNAAGLPTDIPDDKDDDECDAIRYTLMNEFSKGKTSVRDRDIPRPETLKEAAIRVHRAQVMEHVGAEAFQQEKPAVVKKGRFFIAP